MPVTDLERLVRQHHRSLLRTAVLLTGDLVEAEDLVADAYARAWPRIERGDVGEPLAYLRRCLLNGAANQRRHRFVVRRHQHTEHRGSEPVDQSSLADERSVLSAFVRALPLAQREVVALRYLDDLSEAETADLLGIPARHGQVAGQPGPRRPTGCPRKPGGPMTDPDLRLIETLRAELDDLPVSEDLERRIPERTWQRRRRPRRALVAGLAVAAVAAVAAVVATVAIIAPGAARHITGGSTGGSSASCAEPPTPTQAFARYPVVLIGTALPGDVISSEDQSVLVSPARFRVDRYLKGRGPRIVAVATTIEKTSSSGYSIGEDSISPAPSQQWEIYATSAYHLIATACGSDHIVTDDRQGG